MIPSVLIAWKEGLAWIPIMDVAALAAISFILLKTSYTIQVKMAAAVSLLTVLSVFLIGALGSFGIGSVYLLSLSVLIALLFSRRVAYLAIALHFLIFAFFSLAIGFKFVDWPIVYRYPVQVWIAYSLNFLFVDVIVVLEIRHILVGLEATISKEALLLRALQKENEEKTERNIRLADSEGHYKSLFFNNPSPMWIFDGLSLKFLQVNHATVLHYGFSSEEFGQMTIDQIRAEPVGLIASGLAATLSTDTIFNNVALHSKKNGQQFYVKVKCSTIPFEGKRALLVIAQDITSQIAHTQAIEKQNDKLKAIAYMQSHTIRAPLARIKGLWDLIALDMHAIPDPELSAYMQASIMELDQVIRGIVKDTGTVDMDKSDRDATDEMEHR